MNGPPIRRKWTLSVARCDPETAFATVGDIERYPEFLPGIVSARIVTRKETRWPVENSFGFRAHAEPFPERRRIESTNRADNPIDRWAVAQPACAMAREAGRGRVRIVVRRDARVSLARSRRPRAGRRPDGRAPSCRSFRQEVHKRCQGDRR